MSAPAKSEDQQQVVAQPIVDLDAFKQLPKVVVAHLTFQKALSGDPSEGALSYPIQSFLRIKGRSWSIDTEEEHPALKQEKKLGRPPQIDFVGKDRRTGRWSFALEVKIHDSRWDRVIRDFVKLLLLFDDNKTVYTQRYLLLVFPASSRAKKKAYEILNSSTGEIRLNQAIWQLGEKAVNLFEALLPWGQPEKKLWIGDLTKPLVTQIRAALKSFDKTSVRGDVKIRLIARDWSEDFACGLWKLDWKGPAKRFEVGSI